MNIKDKDLKSIIILKETAEKFGYKLIKQERKDPLSKVYENDPMKSYSSEQLYKELKDVELMEQKLNSRDALLRDKIVKFMKDQAPNEMTKTLYSGNRFQDDKIVIRNYEIRKLSDKKSYIVSKLKQALANEFKQKFININNDYEDTINNLKVELGSAGDVLAIDIGSLEQPTIKDKEKDIESDEIIDIDVGYQTSD